MKRICRLYHRRLGCRSWPVMGPWDQNRWYGIAWRTEEFVFDKAHPIIYTRVLLRYPAPFISKKTATAATM